METFIEILSNYLVDNEMSIRTFSKESGISLTTCSEYLKGSEPTIKNAVKIAKYFDCSLDYLFGLSTIKNSKVYKEVNLSTFLERYDCMLKKNKISHFQFSKTVQLSESARRRWRNGDTPKISSLITIARELGSSIDYLVGRV